MREQLYNQVQRFDMNSLREFHNSYISKGTRTILVLGSKEDIDLSVLQEYGEIVDLSLEDVFGY